MANEVKIRITGEDRASGEFDRVERKARGLGGTLRSMAPLALGAGAALGGLAYGASKFADAASDLNEATNKANVTFGEHSDVIEDFAESSARSFGISRRAANDYASTLGVILQASGLNQEATADMSVELTKLAADLASFNNIPVDVALEKIRSGLVGEAEPLRTVGVLLSAAEVKTKAYEMGIAEAGAELTEAQKVQARYALILEQTTQAQGDFTRTADGSANQQRIMAANWEDLRARIGQGFLPVQQKLYEGLNKLFTIVQEKVIPAIQEWWQKHQPEIEAALERFQAFLKNDLMPALENIVAIFETVWPKIEPIVRGVMNEIKLLIEQRLVFIRDLINVVLAVLRGDWEEAWQGIKDLLKNQLDIMKELIENRLEVYKTLLSEAWTAIVNGATYAFTALKVTVLDIFDDLKEGIRAALNWIIDKINAFVGGLNSVLGPIGGLLGKVGVDLPDIGTIPRVASGSRGFPGGLALVGERGPELVDLPGGSRVYSHEESQRLGGTIIHKENYGRQTFIFPQVDPRKAMREMDRQFRSI